MKREEVEAWLPEGAPEEGFPALDQLGHERVLTCQDVTSPAGVRAKPACPGIGVSRSGNYPRMGIYALAFMGNFCREACIGFLIRWHSGVNSPEPAKSREELNFMGYIGIENVIGSQQGAKADPLDRRILRKHRGNLAEIGMAR